jgi:uncharacterized protein YceK
MARATVFTALAVCVVWLSGCGTVNNLSGGQAPYGGVQQDAKAGSKNLIDWRDGYWRVPGGYAIPPSLSLLASAYLLGVDLPLSAVADTLTLPFTVAVAWQKEDSKATPPGTFTPDPIPDPGQQPARPAASPTLGQHPGQ